MSMSTRVRIALIAAVLVAAGLLLAACGGKAQAVASAGCKTVATQAASSAGQASGSWLYSNGDLANTRDAIGSTISSANVSQLAPLWTFKLTGQAGVGVRPYGSLSANP